VRTAGSGIGRAHNFSEQSPRRIRTQWAPTHVESWRKGRTDFLERAIHANFNKISQSMTMFRQWALEKGLKPSETRYERGARTGSLKPRSAKK